MSAADYASFSDLFEQQQTAYAKHKRLERLEETLFSGSSVTVGQYAAERLHSKEKHRISDAAFDEELRIFHDLYMPVENRCPKSGHEVKKVCRPSQDATHKVLSS